MGADGAHLGRATSVLSLVTAAGHQAKALSLTSSGEPGHRLYIPYEAPLRRLDELRSLVAA